MKKVAKLLSALFLFAIICHPVCAKQASQVPLIKVPRDIRVAAMQAANHYNMQATLLIAIAYQESTFYPKAVSPLGKDYGYGLWQISAIALRDYNWKHNTSYHQSDLEKPSIAAEVAAWVFQYNAKYLEDAGVSVTKRNKLLAYNAGWQRVKAGFDSSYPEKVYTIVQYLQY